MTKAQIWVAAFLVVFVILFFAQRLLQNDAPAPAMSSQISMGVPQAATEATGESLIGELGCVNCHGNDLGGTAMGPSLHGLASVYSKEQIVAYLQDPSSQAGSDRYKLMSQRFSGAMPSFRNRDVHELEKIADVLLSIHE